MIVTTSRRSLPQALKRAGLAPPTASHGTVEYLRQRAELCLRLLVAGVDFRAVGSMRWHVEMVAFKSSVGVWSPMSFDWLMESRRFSAMCRP